MNDTDILVGVTAVFRQIFDNPALSVAASTTQEDIADWDSLRFVLLLAALEEQFHIRFTTMDMDRIGGVGDILEILRHKLPT